MSEATGAPARRLAVVACMDARLQPEQLLGLRRGDAHIIRNAGGVITDDVIRSLLISQWLLGTREIVLIHHTDCGMTALDEDQLWGAVEQETGVRPSFALEAFADAEADVVRSIARIRASPFVTHTAAIRGYVYEVATGALREVRPQPDMAGA